MNFSLVIEHIILDSRKGWGSTGRTASEAQGDARKRLDKANQ